MPDQKKTPSELKNQSSESETIPPRTSNKPIEGEEDEMPTLEAELDEDELPVLEAELDEDDTFEAETLAPSQRASVPDIESVQIPGYEILKELGRGGMGVVYLARQIHADRLVALKMILSGGHAGEEDLARFRSEARAIARLQHVNVVQIYEIGEHEGRPFFSLELCPAGSLADALHGSSIPPKEAAALVLKLAEGMHVAHQQNVIHRDLKPANVLLKAEQGEDDGPALIDNLALYQPKITDFGLAKRLDEQGQTQSGAVMGTPAYMAPEQAGGKTQEIGQLVDVYALGAILYELLTGRPPFVAPSSLDTILQVLSQDPVSVRQRNPKVPRDLETICHKCLQKEPQHRYESARDLAEDLRRFLSDEPILARPPGPLRLLNRWVQGNQLLAISTVVLSAGMLLAFLTAHLFLKTIFAAERLSEGAFYFCAVPMAVVMTVCFGTVHRRALLMLLPLAGLGIFLWWYFALEADRTRTDIVWLTNAIGCAGLVIFLIGAVAQNWRLAILVPIPLLAICALLGWTQQENWQPIWTGAFYGLILGALGRIVAWCLNREHAASILGALVGACLGLILVDNYGIRYRVMLSNSGLGFWKINTISLYATVLLAYFGSILFCLLLGRRAQAAPR